MVGLVIVILGGIAVSSVTRVFVLQKMHSIAVLKCVGATQRGRSSAIYMLQVMVLGLAGSLLGVGLARLAIAAIPYVVDTTSTSLLGEVHYGITLSAAAQGIGIGVLVSLLFSVVPLLRVRLVKPSLLLRDESAARPVSTGRASPRSCSCRPALVALTAWQAASLQVGLIVCAGFSVLAVVLHAGRAAAGSRGRAAGQHAVVPAAARRAAPVAPGQPDAGRFCSPSVSARSSSSASGRCSRACSRSSRPR